MTTSVKVTACCGSTTEVKVLITNGEDGESQLITLQNGESTEQYVYDDREISVKEVNK